MIAFRLIVALGLLLSFAACQKSSTTSELIIPPGNQNTFFAAQHDIPATIIDQNATASEPAFRYIVRQPPNKNISVGTAVGTEGQGDLSETQFFTPASITKVITTAVALSLLGPDYRFTTRISWLQLLEGDARDLTIRADGDPIITHERFRVIASELRKRGITRLTGRLNLVSADKRLDRAYPAIGFDKEDYWSCYGARVQNFNLQRNCASLMIEGLGHARWLDSAITTALSFSPVRGQESRLSFAYDTDARFGDVRGYIIAGAPKKGAGIGLPVTDVKGWYMNALVAEIKRAGIDVTQVTAARDLELPANNFFELHSPPISEISRKMNKFSDNFLAEALYKAAAVNGTEENINDAARTVVQTQIRRWLKNMRSENLAEEINLYDGAGLSRASKVTPRAFLALLKAFTEEPWFPVLWEPLPIAGVDGTLRGRMTTNAAGRLVRAKTGTLKGAYQLAGYIPKLSEDGQVVVKFIPFVVLTATTPKNGGSARSFQDKLLGELAQQINKRK